MGMTGSKCIRYLETISNRSFLWKIFIIFIIFICYKIKIKDNFDQNNFFDFENTIIDENVIKLHII